MDSENNDVAMVEVEPCDRFERNEEINEFEQLLQNESIEDEFNESVVTKVVVRESDKEMKSTTIDEQTKIAIYKSLDIPIDDNNKIHSNWRMNTIHIRGVQEMSSDDVLNYFNDYEKNSLEWVNDLSCNIVFDSEDYAAFVMKDMTTSIVVKGNKYKDVTDPDVEVIDGDMLEVSIPPGRWRLGKPCEKSKVLLLRFATFNDKKVKGARSFSQYYLKYGYNNENSKKTDSDSMVKQFRRRINFENESDSAKTKSTKLMRMRMRADDEEVNMKLKCKPSLKIQLLRDSTDSQRDVKSDENDRISIWNRLDTESGSKIYSVFGNRARRSIWNRLEKPRGQQATIVGDLRSKIKGRRMQPY
ncbi:uncharacterized protein B4U79_14648 [Dinothrombium tinctorium]|uniref:Nuclear cap-binding protein subunit 3 n=1 Tax=Dinothrombium tinctorium TaxID=1965070 RepID=A0A3S3P0M3_9ACAR|nr:uncharacterized protein B4U79_06391 [Dinothrombium tinctorium]RWS05642.1 uncharacterized protein B4U79_14648 [Dinothrombium tinctorium]